MQICTGASRGGNGSSPKRTAIAGYIRLARRGGARTSATGPDYVAIASVAFTLIAIAGLLSSQPARTVATANGAQIPIPSGWHWNQAISENGGPLALRNFDRYESGGVPPVDGAEIDLTRVSAPRNLSEYIQRELIGSQAESPVESPIRSNPAVEVAFTDKYGDLQLANRALYILHGATLYKLYLMFRAGDPRAAEYATAFHQLALQARFE